MLNRVLKILYLWHDAPYSRNLMLLFNSWLEL